MGENTHSPIGASSWYRWKACPGSVRLSDGIESKSSHYAEEGTKAHNIAAAILENGILPQSACTKEMFEAANVYVEEVIKWWNIADGESELLIEHKFDLSGKIFPGLYGTADAVIYDEPNRTLRVFDFKYGAGMAVEVENNLQLIYYALGALLTKKYVADVVEMVIVQPRCPHPDGPVRSWSLDAIDLLDYAAQLKEDALKTLEKDAPLSSGEHCKFCPAAPTCPELNKKALAIAQSEFSDVTKYDLSEALNLSKILKSWIDRVEQYAYEEAKQGRPPKGYKLVPKRSVRRWRLDEDQTAKALEGLLLARESHWDIKLKSPAQVEKLLPKGTDISDLVISTSTGYTLVPESDKRSAVQLDAISEFTEVNVRGDFDDTEV